MIANVVWDDLISILSNPQSRSLWCYKKDENDGMCDLVRKHAKQTSSIVHLETRGVRLYH